MAGSTLTISSENQTFPSSLKLYLWLILLIVLAAASWLLFKKPLLLMFAISGSVAVFFIVTPRVALLQFLFFIFFNPAKLISFNTYLIDFSAVIVILAAAFDLLLNTDTTKKQIPTLSKNYLILLSAVLFTSLFSFNIIAAIKPAMRLLLMFCTFLSLYRLMKYEKIDFLIKAFLTIATLHGLIITFQFVLSGGSERAFGFSHIIFDDLAMISVPIALSYFLWSERGKRGKYLLIFLILMIALLATQSRVSIVYGLTAITLVILLSFRKAKLIITSSVIDTIKTFSNSRYVRSLISRFALGVILIIAVMVVTKVDLLLALQMRFERLLTSTPSGTFATRITLWKAALRSFLDYPLVGLGPGYFKYVASVYTTFHLELLHFWIRGLSAHNLSLHYLAETGLIGAIALWTLFIRQFRIAKNIWKNTSDVKIIRQHLSLYIVATILLFSTFIEAGWMWGSVGYLALFFIVLVNRTYDNLRHTTSGH